MALDEARATSDSAADHLSDHNTLHAAYNALEGSWLMNLFLNPDTPHTDDQEFTDTLGGTAVTPSGTATWSQDKSLLSVVVDGQSSADICGRMYALTPNSAPVTIEAAFTVAGDDQAYIWAGIGFSDGTATSSNAVHVGYYASTANGQFQPWHGTFTNQSSSEDAFYVNDIGPQPPRWWVRLIWSAPNTFKAYMSMDSVTWHALDTSISDTLTPTHFGAIATTWGGNEEVFATWDYIRVYESDLSA